MDVATRMFIWTWPLTPGATRPTSSSCPRAPSSQWPAWSAARRGAGCGRAPPWCRGGPGTIPADSHVGFAGSWNVPVGGIVWVNVTKYRTPHVYYLQFPGALRILAPRVGGHEGPLGEAIAVVIVVGPPR